jgi:hypothetical protein
LVIYPERRGDTGCVHTGGEGQSCVFVFQQPVIALLWVKPP